MTIVSERTEGLTVEQVAGLTGTSVRTIRWYQSEGLLPSPRREGRTARYDTEHVQRLEAIRDLQAHGLTLVAIRRLLEKAPDTAANALAFVHAAVSPIHGGDEEVLDAREGAARLGSRPSEALTAHLERLGIIRVLEPGRWEVPSPALFRAAEELSALQIPVESRLALLGRLKDQAESMAGTLVGFFTEHLCPQSAEHANDPEAWATMSRALERLRPLATASLVALLDTALARAAERALERELGRDPDLPDGETVGGHAAAHPGDR